MGRLWVPVGIFCVVLVLAACSAPGGEASDPLPSWNEGKTRQAIVAFVESVADPDSTSFVPVSERVAVFDNDGTLWGEQPAYVQAQFAFDQVRAQAGSHPEWQEQQPFKAILEGDMATAMAGGTRSLVQVIMATHAGTSTEEFAGTVAAWLDVSTHPTTGKAYTEMVYQPMLELLAYLRANDFKTYIVSGGGIEFMRPWTDAVYGIPPEQVVGSSIKTDLAEQNGVPVLMRLPEMNFVDDGPGKPVGINQHIGRRPIAAFGNSDGDLQMLQWTMAGGGPRFAMIVHHTDAEREWAYDRDSHVGHLDKALDEAGTKGWAIADMKRDWNTIYPATNAR
jgi:phosphoglycolate phosphatase-like HAD superfamily hydrolase